MIEKCECGKSSVVKVRIADPKAIEALGNFTARAHIAMSVPQSVLEMARILRDAHPLIELEIPVRHTTIRAKLDEASDLRVKGLITQSEYERMKGRILGI